jgi:TrmH family RNA methyltransferase
LKTRGGRRRAECYDFPMSRLTSRRHPIVAACRALAAGRGEPGRVLLEGAQLTADALDAGIDLDAFVTDGRHPELAARAAAAGAVVYDAPRAVADAASPARTPGGAVAIARWAPAALDRLSLRPDADVVALAGVQDPGNVGSVIRSADAFGAAVVVLDGSADPGNWKALRGAMGSTFRVPVARATVDDALAWAARTGRRLAAAVPRGGVPPDDAALDGPLLLLLGREGAGLDDALVQRAAVRVTVPMRGGVDSLNVGVTAAILLWARAHLRAGVR